MFKKILFIVAAALLYAGPGNVYAADGVKVCVLPFTVNSKDSIDYLSRALPDMVATRLEKPGEIMVVPKPVVAKALAAARVEGLHRAGVPALSAGQWALILSLAARSQKSARRQASTLPSSI